MFDKILSVCTGNICRSPLAEAWLRHLLQGRVRVQVRSAGIGALVGEPADEAVQRIACEDAALTTALAAHRAQQLVVGLTRWADLILAMEPHHARYVIDMDPTARGKTFLFGHWSGNTPIADPFQRGDEAYRRAHAQIGQEALLWTERLG